LVAMILLSHHYANVIVDTDSGHTPARARSPRGHTHNLALLCLIRFLEINLIRDAGTIKNLDHRTCLFLTQGIFPPSPKNVI
jgi:hypothetical protein